MEVPSHLFGCLPPRPLKMYRGPCPHHSSVWATICEGWPPAGRLGAGHKPQGAFQGLPSPAYLTLHLRRMSAGDMSRKGCEYDMDLSALR